MNIFKRFKTWIITFLIGGVVLAAGNAMLPNNSFENLPNVAREVGIYKLTVDKYTEIEIPEKTKPEATLRKWGDETYIKVWYDDIEYSNSKQDKGKLKWNGSKKEVHLYEIEKGFEFEVILKEKPVSNVIELGIESKGLDFFYQPALHPDHPTYDERTWNEERQDWDYNSFRPENVVGSYAVYHSGNPINYVGGTEYKTGKAFHIYRPQMEDANGWKVWAENFEIDIENEKQYITMPIDFWKTAKYPIRHANGEEFGYTTEGSSGDDNFTSGVINFDNATGVSGTGVSMSAYIKCDANGSGSNLQYYLYDTSLNKVTNGVTDENTNITNTSYSLHTLNFTSAPTLTAQTYYLAMWTDASGGPGGNLYVAYDTAAGNDAWFDSNSVSYKTWPATLTKSGTVSDSRFSIYITYTPSGASAPYNPRLRRVIIVD